MCDDPGVTNEKPQDQPESKFAEVIRKCKEKRAAMEQQSERPADIEQAFKIFKDSET